VSDRASMFSFLVRLFQRKEQPPPASSLNDHASKVRMVRVVDVIGEDEGFKKDMVKVLYVPVSNKTRMLC
jgi:hypothetical protein